jgi:hypothetical protein
MCVCIFAGLSFRRFGGLVGFGGCACCGQFEANFGDSRGFDVPFALLWRFMSFANSGNRKVLREWAKQAVPEMEGRIRSRL